MHFLNLGNQFQSLFLISGSVELSVGFGVEQKLFMELVQAKGSDKFFVILMQGLEKILEEFLFLGEGDFFLYEILFVVGDEISLQEGEVVLDKCGEIHVQLMLVLY